MKLKPSLVYLTILVVVGLLVFSLVLERAGIVAGSRMNENVTSLEKAGIAYPILLLLFAPSSFFGIIIVVGGVILYLLNSSTKQGGKIPFGLLLIIISLPVLACPLCLLLSSALRR